MSKATFNKKVFIVSCHASLEYDQILMFRGLGYRVAGNFDTGNAQRPHVPGCDVSYPVDVGAQESDVVVLHQVPNYPVVFDDLCGKRAWNQPVILVNFGQGDMNTHGAVARILKVHPNAWLVNYSRTDMNRMIALGAPGERMRMIRFGKLLEEYEGWIGDVCSVYVSGNSIHRRGLGCGWDKLVWLIKHSGFPIILSGKETEEVGGIGELTYGGLRSMYKHMRCFVSFGTTPAPYVLTLMEAMCTGCPVIAWDNGCGIANEELSVILVKSRDELINNIRLLLHNDEIAHVVSERMYEVSRTEFDMVTVGQQWDKFIEEAMA